ncbi:MAG TPA: alpha/beta fold hydrolase [Bacteroidales bacterium]|nr:alpha/beta fold hydrolase [Bacteroidales bacterium]
MKPSRSTTVLHLLLVTIMMLLPASLSFSQSTATVQGIWVGVAEINADVKLTVAFEIFGGEGQPATGFMHSIEQKAFNIPVKEVIVIEDTVRFVVPAIKAEFAGIVLGETIIGDITQGMNKPWPVTLTRSDRLPVDKPGRPQEPVRPLPYYEEAVKYNNEGAGVTLAGIFTRPSAEGKYPAVILISGSGPNDRDESIFGHKIFLVLADQLTRSGFAVLRVDDRGVGESTGDFPSATVTDLASDVVAGAAFLMSRPDVDSKKIGLIGHSLGGDIAPIAASKSKDIAYIVLMAGAAKPLYQVIYEQCDAIFATMGIRQEAIDINRKVLETLFETIKTEKDSAVAKKIIREKFLELDKEVAGLSEDERRQIQLSYPLNPGDADYYYRPAKRFDFFYDPAEYLRKVKCPVLALIGSKDIQVLPSHLVLIEDNLRKAKNKNFEVMELEGLNHLFQTCQSCTVEEYSLIPETLSPVFITVITDWLRKTTNQ